MNLGANIAKLISMIENGVWTILFPEFSWERRSKLELCIFKPLSDLQCAPRCCNVRDMSLQKQEFYKIGKRNDCPTKISLKSQCTQLRQRCFQNTYLVQF